MEEHTKADYDYQTTVATVLSLARRAKEIFESSEVQEKTTFLNYLFQNSTLKGRKLDLKLRSPFHLVLELSSSPVWLPLLDRLRTDLMGEVMRMGEEVKMVQPSFVLSFNPAGTPRPYGWGVPAGLDLIFQCQNR